MCWMDTEGKSGRLQQMQPRYDCVKLQFTRFLPISLFAIAHGFRLLSFCDTSEIDIFFFGKISSNLKCSGSIPFCILYQERLLRFCHENFGDILTNPVEWLVEGHRRAHSYQGEEEKVAIHLISKF